MKKEMTEAEKDAVRRAFRERQREIDEERAPSWMAAPRIGYPDPHAFDDVAPDTGTRPSDVLIKRKDKVVQYVIDNETDGLKSPFVLKDHKVRDDEVAAKRKAAIEAAKRKLAERANDGNEGDESK